MMINVNRPDDELENEFWIEASWIAKEQGKTLGEFMDSCVSQDPKREPASAVRVQILKYIKAKMQAAQGSPSPLL